MTEAVRMEIDGAVEMKPKIDGPSHHKRKPLKRKRLDSTLFPSTPQERLEKINKFSSEINSLVKFCKKDLVLENLGPLSENVGNSLNVLVACLMEESNLPLSKLVDEIFEKVKGRSCGNGETTVGKVSVKSTVLIIGQRLCYGVTNADADVLEDDSDSALWCWETRDLKLIPKVARLSLKVRRTCRKKIHERIIALLAMIRALGKFENHQNCQQELIKASEKLGKVLNEADIQLIVQNMSQKTDAEIAHNEAKKEGELLIKEMEKNKREMEKERKKKDRELQKDKLQSEKELKRLHDEAEKEEKRREKEAHEIQKQMKKQQEEAEKPEKAQLRKEKEETELKRRVALQKQASVMERFLKRQNTSASQHDSSLINTSDAVSSSNVAETKSESVTLAMDSVLAQNCGVDAEAIWKLHLNSWRCVGRSIRSDRKLHWGLRQKPKTGLIKELKLTTNKETTLDDALSIEKLVDGQVDSNVDERLSLTPLSDGQRRVRSRQLLQFDKSHRPAFYGVWSLKSVVVSSRHPFAKDPDVDYEIDSDEEWEEDEPGEFLSDCDKDDENENLEGHLKGDDEDEDEDESEDGFFVPDGYLSESEGVHDDEIESEEFVEEVRDLPDTDEQQVQSEELCTLFRQQKYLNNLTDHALKKNQPLIILNLMHEKTTSLSADELTGMEKIERMCLQTLCICPLLGFSNIEIISIDGNVVDVSLEASSNKSNTTPFVSGTSVLDSDVPQIISFIQSCPHSIGKIVESLQNTFSTVSKSQLRNKVREISEFSDNRWQVKKEILSKFGLSLSPENKCGGKPKTITTFFSKRCLPPPAVAKNSIMKNLSEISPKSSDEKSVAVIQPQQQGSSSCT